MMGLPYGEEIMIVGQTVALFTIASLATADKRPYQTPQYVHNARNCDV